MAKKRVVLKQWNDMIFCRTQTTRIHYDSSIKDRATGKIGEIEKISIDMKARAFAVRSLSSRINPMQDVFIHVSEDFHINPLYESVCPKMVGDSCGCNKCKHTRNFTTTIINKDKSLYRKKIKIETGHNSVFETIKFYSKELSQYEYVDNIPLYSFSKYVSMMGDEFNNALKSMLAYCLKNMLVYSEELIYIKDKTTHLEMVMHTWKER